MEVPANLSRTFATKMCMEEKGILVKWEWLGIGDLAEMWRREAGCDKEGVWVWSRRVVLLMGL